MRNKPLPIIEPYRELFGRYASRFGDPHGRFVGVRDPNEQLLRILSSGQCKENPWAEGWEHVSVSVEGSAQTPTWEQMCFAKTLFWAEDETVIQFHPKATEYVNHHPGCLHLWKRDGKNYALPPMWMVGAKQQKEGE